MDYYKALIDKKIFKFKELVEIVGNESTAKKVIDRYINENYVDRIRRDLYVVINLETHNSIADKFIIASTISKDSTISSITALEYYGYYNQVRNDCYVSTSSRFREFTYNGIVYKKINRKGNTIINNQGIRITDLEKSLIDTIIDSPKIITLNELYNCISMIPWLDENKLIKYLDEYNIQFYYQKTGYILENFKDDLGFSDRFFKYLNSKVKSKRILDVYNTDKYVFNKKWKLYVPKEKNDIYEIY